MDTTSNPSTTTPPESAATSTPANAPGAEASAPAEGTSAAPSAASSAPATAPAAPAAPVANMKGLPPVKRAQVIGAEGEAPRGGGFGGRPGDRGPGRGFGDRGPRRGGGGGEDRSGQVGRGETQQTLRAVTDEARGESSALDAQTMAEVEAMMSDANAGTGGRVKAPAHDVVVPKGGRQAAPVRGPRVVQSGREHRTGKVVSVGPNDIFIEFGPKELGVLPRLQYKEGDELPVVGGEVEVVVDKFSAEESLFICSKPGAIVKAAWELLEIGQNVEARVTGTNKGGLELEVAGHRAFMPASQVSLDRIPDLSVMIGEKLVCQVMQLDRRGAGNIVLSRRDLLKAERQEKASKLKDTLKEGQVVEGTVRKIMPFGAFVDIGGIDGLCHISDMTYDRVMPTEKNVQKYVKEGDKVKVQILKLDIDGDRVSLGMKQLGEDPFMSATKGEIVEGATVTGSVVRLTEFGAFVKLAEGVDGLVHISEIARRRINKPDDVLKVDQVVQAKVLKIDPGTRKIALSIKALTPEEAPAPGSREAKFAEKRAARDAADAARLAELEKETPELRRKREQFRNKSLTGGFGKALEPTKNPLGLTLGQR
jgi:predicted RNA-binding protein with RPS1 domain